MVRIFIELFIFRIFSQIPYIICSQSLRYTVKIAYTKSLMRNKSQPTSQDDFMYEMVIERLGISPYVHDLYRHLILTTDRGDIEARYYHAPDAHQAVLLVGDSQIGYTSPAHNLYTSLGQELMLRRISCLQIQFRYPTSMTESILDVLSGITFLQSNSVGTRKLGLVGYSFGGSVVIQAAAAAQTVDTVITLATHSTGADSVLDFISDIPLLIIHGKRDEVRSPSSSIYLHQLASEPKKLILYENARHSLDEVAETLHTTLRDWLIEKLG